MTELIKDIQELRRIFDYYRVQINSGNPVNIPQGDIAQMLRLIDQLRRDTVHISPCVSAELKDIEGYLFVTQGPGFTTFNPYRFGALGAALRYLQSDEFACDSARFVRTPWDDVNAALKKLLIDANSVESRLDYNKVGVTARELYIMLAQKVYTSEVRQFAVERRIGPADAKGMLEAFFDYKSTDDDVKRYAKETIKLAEPLTHTKSENEEKLNTLVMAVVCLTGIVNAIYQS